MSASPGCGMGLRVVAEREHGVGPSVVDEEEPVVEAQLAGQHRKMLRCMSWTSAASFLRKLRRQYVDSVELWVIDSR